MRALALWDDGVNKREANRVREDEAQKLEQNLRELFKGNLKHAKEKSTDAKGGGVHDYSDYFWSVTYLALRKPA